MNIVGPISPKTIKSLANITEQCASGLEAWHTINYCTADAATTLALTPRDEFAQDQAFDWIWIREAQRRDDRWDTAELLGSRPHG